MIPESIALEASYVAESSTVLIVDDTHAGRVVMDALLQQSGYHLAFACNGFEALQQAAELMPDLILLDVMMPDMDGFEVCRRLRSDPLLAEVPVIMVTALDDQQSRLQGIESGADDIISKPFNRAELLARVRTVTRLNRYRRLLSERTRFEWVVEQADDGYLIVDDNDMITYANAQARRYLELPTGPGASITEPFLALATRLYRCEPQQVWNAWPGIAPQDTPLYLVFTETRHTRAIWLQVDMLDSTGIAQGRRLIRLRDVTAQIDLRRDMRNFHSMVFHKLRTPMVSLVGGLDMLNRKVGKAPEVAASLAELSLKGAKRLQSTILDILQYLDAAHMTDTRGEFPPGNLAAVVTATSIDLDIQNITLSIEETLPCEQTIALSQQAIELMLWEVLENTRKFHPQQSPTVDVSIFAADAQRICIRVCDDGMTLSPQQLAYAWMPYYQGEKEFTGEVPGIGLGLASVASLLWQASGTCHIANRPDAPGVIIELYLPLGSTAAA